MNRDGSKGAGVLMEDVRNTGTSSEKAGSDLEVPAKAKRRRFTADWETSFTEDPGRSAVGHIRFHRGMVQSPSTSLSHQP